MTSTHKTRYKAFLKKLKAARLSAGMTQAQAAAALGKPQSYVSKCESGERRVDVIELMDFAAVYQKQTSFFVADIPLGSARSQT